MPDGSERLARREWTEECRLVQHRRCEHIGSARTVGLLGQREFVTICGCPCHWGCPSEEVSLPDMSRECICSGNGEVRQDNFERFAKLPRVHRAGGTVRNRDSDIGFALGLVVALLLVSVYLFPGWPRDLCLIAMALLFVKLCEPQLMRCYPKSQWARRFVRRPPQGWQDPARR